MIGLVHGLGNVTVVLLFLAGWWMRYSAAAEPVPYDPAALGHVLSFAGFSIALVTGWLGGELVDRLGIGVHEGANANAPSSLTGRPARS